MVLWAVSVLLPVLLVTLSGTVAVEATAKETATPVVDILRHTVPRVVKAGHTFQITVKVIGQIGDDTVLVLDMYNKLVLKRRLRRQARLLYAGSDDPRTVTLAFDLTSARGELDGVTGLCFHAALLDVAAYSSKEYVDSILRRPGSTVCHTQVEATVAQQQRTSHQHVANQHKLGEHTQETGLSRAVPPPTRRLHQPASTSQPRHSPPKATTTAQQGKHVTKVVPARKPKFCRRRRARFRWGRPPKCRARSPILLLKHPFAVAKGSLSGLSRNLTQMAQSQNIPMRMLTGSQKRSWLLAFMYVQLEPCRYGKCSLVHRSSGGLLVSPCVFVLKSGAVQIQITLPNKISRLLTIPMATEYGVWRRVTIEVKEMEILACVTPTPGFPHRCVKYKYVSKHKLSCVAYKLS